jgi:hypothetical protein
MNGAVQGAEEGKDKRSRAPHPSNGSQAASLSILMVQRSTPGSTWIQGFRPDYPLPAMLLFKSSIGDLSIPLFSTTILQLVLHVQLITHVLVQLFQMPTALC